MVERPCNDERIFQRLRDVRIKSGRRHQRMGSGQGSASGDEKRRGHKRFRTVGVDAIQREGGSDATGGSGI